MSEDTESPHDTEEGELTVLGLLERVAKTSLLILARILDVVAAITVPATVLYVVSFINGVVYVPTLVIRTPAQNIELPATWIVISVAFAILFSRLLRLLLNKWPGLVYKGVYTEADDKDDEEQHKP